MNRLISMWWLKFVKLPVRSHSHTPHTLYLCYPYNWSSNVGIVLVETPQNESKPAIVSTDARSITDSKSKTIAGADRNKQRKESLVLYCPQKASAIPEYWVKGKKKKKIEVPTHIFSEKPKC